jgi:hypothetical protein
VRALGKGKLEADVGEGWRVAAGEGERGGDAAGSLSSSPATSASRHRPPQRGFPALGGARPRWSRRPAAMRSYRRKSRSWRQLHLLTDMDACAAGAGKGGDPSSRSRHGCAHLGTSLPLRPHRSFAPPPHQRARSFAPPSGG